MTHRFYILFFFIGVQPILGQRALLPDSVWHRSLQAYATQDFASAAAGFQDPALQSAPFFQAPARYFEGQTLYELGAFDEALIVLQDYLRRWPEHRYADEAQMLLGHCLYHQGQFVAALTAWLDVYRHLGESSTLGREAGALAAALMPEDLTLDRILELREQYRSSDVTHILDIKLADRLAKSGELSRAENLIAAVLRDSSDRVYEPVARKLESFLQLLASAPVEIAVLLPAHSVYAEQARMIYEGARQAMLEHNEASSPLVTLRVEEYNGTAADAARAMARLVQIPAILGVIGPVAPEAHLPTALQAHHLHLPVVMPLAQNPELTPYADYVTQIRTDYRSQGHSLARYILEETGRKRFAVVSSVSPNHREFADSFTETVDDLGGEIVSVQYYYPEVQDMEEQFSIIRESGAQLMFQDSLHFFADTSGFEWEKLSGEQIDSLTQVFREVVQRQQMAVEHSHNTPGRPEVDPLDQAVTSLDGFCLLADAQDAPIVFSQYRYYNFESAVFGGPDWYRPDTPKEEWLYPDGLIFSADYYLNEEDEVYAQFRNRFRMASQADPTFSAIQGYNAMRVFLEALRDGVRSRQLLALALRKLPEIRGVAGIIRIDPDTGTNTWVNILQIRRGYVSPAPRGSQRESSVY